MTTIEEIKDSLNRKFGRDKRLEWKGVLGRADGTVDAGNHLVYVTLYNGDVITMHNGKVPNIPYKKIIFGYDSQYPDLLQVLKVEDVYNEAPVPNLANHKDSHHWFSYDPLEIAPEQFYPLLARAAGGMTLRIYAGNYIANGTNHTFPTTDLDLTDYIPGSGAKWVNIEVDENGDVSYTEGDEYATRALLVPENIPTLSSAKHWLCSVKVYLGQTSIIQTRTNTDIYDPRFSNPVGVQNIYDAEDITYTPTTPADWDCLADPGDVNNALDQLAERTTDLEAGGGGGTPGGSDTEIQYNNGGSFGGDAEFTWDDVTKALGIGDPALLPGISPDHTFWMVGDGISPSQFMTAYGSARAGFLSFMKADGSGATPTNVKDNQVIGRIRGRGHDGTGFTDTRIEIRFVADADWGVNDTPTRIELYTCPDGSGTLTLAMTIGSDGNINIASGKTYNINGSPHTHDASVVTYAPAVAADWDSSTDPGDVDNALDQLAERVTDIEGAGSGDWVLISDSVLGSSAANFDLTSIPGTYKHLRLDYSLRSDRSGFASDRIKVVVNNDTGSDKYDSILYYWYHSSTWGTYDSGVSTYAQCSFVCAANALANSFGGGFIEFSDYTSTSKLKLFQSRGGQEQSTTIKPEIYDGMAQWKDTSAITRLTISPAFGSNWVTGSRVTLYGRK